MLEKVYAYVVEATKLELSDQGTRCISVNSCS
ncbi:hypothetical protein HMPREF0981_03448 [Erysipelotrichaceae bacterium 6_1_45]|nr:hypothetical protein HMPREF0981_03448 [Erysipelotrichaceae bacterium 6_1_45]